MLDQLFQDPRSLAMAQAAVAIVLAMGVILLARRWDIHLERETIVALIRGLVQVVAVGSVLLVLLQAPAWISMPKYSASRCSRPLSNQRSELFPRTRLSSVETE